MDLTLIILALAGISFWAGFRAEPHPLQYLSKAGFWIMLILAGFTGYFAWREARTVGELADLIDPVPEITDVTYVPTSGEVAAISEFLAAVPGRSPLGSTREERRGLAERAKEPRPEYWLIKTSLSIDSVFAFYREVAPRRRWNVETDDPPWLMLSRGTERLVLFVTDDFPRPGTRLLYAVSDAER